MFFYIEWGEREVLSRMTSEIGWDYPRELSTWRFDCKVWILKNFMWSKTIKVTEKDDCHSKMIRGGLITRDEALERRKTR